MSSKKSVLSIVLVLITISSLSCQIGVGTSWGYPIFGFPFGQSTYVNVYRVTGDTILNDTTAFIIEKTYESCELRPTEEYIHVDGGKDKWYYYNENEGGFKILYDFGLNVGDTMHLELWDEIVNFGGIDDFGILSKDIYIIVDNISMVEYGNELLKTFFTRYEWQDEGISYSVNRTIVENIGCLNSFMHFSDNGFCDLSWHNQIRCYINPMDTVNFTNIGCFDILSSTSQIESNKKRDVKLFPNPYVDVISIMVDNKYLSNWGLIVIDLQGRTIIEKNFTGDISKDLDVIKDLLPGVYYMKIHDGISDSIFVEKIIKN